MFIDGPEFVLVHAQLDSEGNILVKFQTNPTSGFGGESITRNVSRRTVGGTEGRRRVPDRKKSSSQWTTFRKADNIKKSPQNGPQI